MEIVWLGHSCFRIRGREATIVTDPCPPASGYTIGKPTADIVTISHHHENHSFLKAVAGSPTVVDGPGEYEISGAFVTGIATHHDDQKGEARGSNITFIMEMEDIKVCHLGDLGHTPTAEQAEEMTGVDILFVPVGGSTTLDGVRAAEVVSLLEARLVIPMHYKTDAFKGDLEPPDRFLKEMGAAPHEPQPKVSVTRNSLPADTQVMILDYRGSGAPRA
jgi:L-ascorbate metabolism protein UlaG (beta-lactamase superfamily)